MVEPVLLCAFLRLASLTLTGIRPANIEQSLLSPSNFEENLRGHITMLFSPNFLHCYYAKELALVPDVLLLLTLHTRALLPISST